LELLASFDFRIAEPASLADMPRLSALAAAYQLTAYDAAYLDLAQRLSLPIATLDEDLKRAAVQAGVRAL
jgi:predicted nucleic acid-binding protein